MSVIFWVYYICVIIVTFYYTTRRIINEALDKIDSIGNISGEDFGCYCFDSITGILGSLIPIFNIYLMIHALLSYKKIIKVN